MVEFIDEPLDHTASLAEASRTRQRLEKQRAGVATRRPVVLQARIPFEAFRRLFGETSPDQDITDRPHIER